MQREDAVFGVGVLHQLAAELMQICSFVVGKLLLDPPDSTVNNRCNTNYVHDSASNGLWRSSSDLESGLNYTDMIALLQRKLMCMPQKENRLMGRKYGFHILCIRIVFFTTFLMLGLPCLSGTLPASQAESLLRLAKLLENPPALSSWNPQTDFCNLPPSPFVNLTCREKSLVALQITGGRIAADQKLHSDSTVNDSRLSDSFSAGELASALLKFSALEDLTLVSLGLWGAIPGKLDHLPSLKALNFSSNFFSGSVPRRFSSLQSLEVLALDNNAISGAFPEWLNSLPTLKTLHLSKNRLAGSLPSNLSAFQSLNSLLLDENLFTGSLPPSLADLRALQTLSLSRNHLSGGIPNLSGLKNLEILDLGENALGPEFPMLGNQLVELVLRKNTLKGPLPSFLELSSIKVLDLSSNQLSGSLPQSILVAPAIKSLNLSSNRLTGNLSYNLELSGSLTQLDISSNFFTGRLPRIFEKPEVWRSIKFQANCFSSRSQQQLPLSHCQLAAMRLTSPHKSSNTALVVGIIGGVCLLAAIFFTMFVALVICRRRQRHSQRKKTTHHGSSSCADSVSLGVPSELLTQARYLSQSIRLGVLGAPQNRVFAMHELEEATNNFSETAYIGEGQLGKVYKGRLENGSVVSIKCIMLDGRLDLKQLKSRIEILAKLRHKNLVCLIGHCLEREPDDQKYQRLFLVSEFVDNGTLRSHLHKSHESLNWSRRLAAAVGAGKGIQYLHTGVVPGIFNNDVKITNILLDHSLVAKASDFGLGSLVHDSKSSVKLPAKKLVPRNDSDVYHRKLLSDKLDVYNFGLILLELVLGRPPIVEYSATSNPIIKELDTLLLETDSSLNLVDPAIRSCMRESLSTVLEIAAKCLSGNPAIRPSMEDVLWNLQYAAQVQDKVSGSFQEEYPTYYLPG